MTTRRITIRGRRYRVTSHSLDGLIMVGEREIWLRPSLRRGRERTETILHEGLHAAFPELHERVVSRVARDLARLLVVTGEIKK